MILAMALFFSRGSAQDSDGQTNLVDRQPVVAGQFYAGDAGRLKADLSSLFANAEPKQLDNVVAIISPHAGYVFSGEVAASAFNQIDPQKKYDNIFVVASSHRVSFSGASIYNKGNYKTPLGKVKVNLELANKLVNNHTIFTFRQDAHSQEHSLEVQLPFLQYIMETDFQIVPIVIGTQNQSDCNLIADALKPYLNQRNLFVISSDFSHYPDYENAQVVDHLTADAIVSNDPDQLMGTLSSNSKKGVSNLATSLCGWSSVLSLMKMTTGRSDMQYHKVVYKNSGDAALYGDKDRVVGYYSIAVTAKKQEADPTGYFLQDEDKKELLHIARNTIENYIANGKSPEIKTEFLTERVQEPCGAFVTLHKEGKLRGCIGRFDAKEPLYLVVQEMAISASTKDYRFPKVTADEIDELDIEISVLTPMQKIKSIDEIELGKHGIYIKKGYSSGTFLPQVATETGWSKEEFLGHCARDKAKIGWDGWKNADIFIYEALIFSEKEFE